MNLHSKFTRIIALALALSIPFSTGAFAQTKHLKTDANGRIVPVVGDIKMSPEQQIELGRKAAAEAERQLPILPESSPVTKYVQQLGAKLAAKAPGYKWPYYFKVVNQKEINAFALPGGPMYVNLGTIQQADESELAGVMAHELSHVVMQHSAREASKSQGIQVLGALGAVLAGAVLGNGMAGQLAQVGIQVGASGVVMKYSREAETEADLVGAQIMYDAGYDPYSMVEFFQKLSDQSGGSGGPQFLSDHPNPGNRAQTVAQAIRKFPKNQFARSDSPEFVSMKQIADGMKPLTAQQIAQLQKSGTINNGRNDVRTETVGMNPVDRNNAIPSRSMSDLNQGNFKIRYPSNWKVNGNQSTSIVIAPEAWVASDAIAYGVTILAAKSNSSTPLDDITFRVIESLKQSNPGIRTAGNPQPVKVNGRNGRSIDLLAVSPIRDQAGGKLQERNWLVAVEDGSNSALVLVFTSPDQDFDKLRPTYEAMLRSLHLE